MLRFFCKGFKSGSSLVFFCPIPQWFKNKGVSDIDAILQLLCIVTYLFFAHVSVCPEGLDLYDGFKPVSRRIHNIQTEALMSLPTLPENILDGTYQ